MSQRMGYTTVWELKRTVFVHVWTDKCGNNSQTLRSHDWLFGRLSFDLQHTAEITWINCMKILQILCPLQTKNTQMNISIAMNLAEGRPSDCILHLTPHGRIQSSLNSVVNNFTTLLNRVHCRRGTTDVDWKKWRQITTRRRWRAVACNKPPANNKQQHNNKSQHLAKYKPSGGGFSVCTRLYNLEKC